MMVHPAFSKKANSIRTRIIESKTVWSNSDDLVERWVEVKWTATVKEEEEREVWDLG